MKIDLLESNDHRGVDPSDEIFTRKMLKLAKKHRHRPMSEHLDCVFFR